jgi:ribosomal protein S18 acetylase RimI-like enzyme
MTWLKSQARSSTTGKGRGLGRELLGRVIERARANMIARLTARAFSDNAAALALLRSVGFAATRRGSGVSELQLQLTGTSGATHAFARWGESERVGARERDALHPR